MVMYPFGATAISVMESPKNITRFAVTGLNELVTIMTMNKRNNSFRYIPVSLFKLTELQVKGLGGMCKSRFLIAALVNHGDVMPIVQLLPFQPYRDYVV